MLLTDRHSVFKKLYRAPIDWLEERTTGMADCVLVNSQFTAGVFHDTFRSLSHVVPEVLYPVPDCCNVAQQSQQLSLIPADARSVFLSINRYERKKNIALALEALAELRDSVTQVQFAGVQLVVAGGYDELVAENHEYLSELHGVAVRLGVSSHVTFLCNLSDAEKQSLLLTATCLLYTPHNEHFGIVPVESMHARCPVIAVDSGGPRETIVDGVTGFLRPATATAFAEAMRQFVDDKGTELRHALGEAGRQRVQQYFSYDTFTVKLDGIVRRLCLSAVH